MSVRAWMVGAALVMAVVASGGAAEASHSAEHAKKHPELIVQHGMQRRSDEAWLKIKDFIRSGAIGW